MIILLLSHTGLIQRVKSEDWSHRFQVKMQNGGQECAESGWVTGITGIRNDPAYAPSQVQWCCSPLEYGARRRHKSSKKRPNSAIFYYLLLLLLFLTDTFPSTIKVRSAKIFTNQCMKTTTCDALRNFPNTLRFITLMRFLTRIFLVSWLFNNTFEGHLQLMSARQPPPAPKVWTFW